MEPEGIPGWLHRKFTTRQRELIGLAAEGALLVVLLSVSTFAWNQRHVSVQTKTVVITKNLPQSPTPTPLPPVPSETLTIPIDSVAAGYKLSLQVPTAWRAVDVRAQASLRDYPGYNGGDLAALLRFVPEHAERSLLYPAVEPVNTLDVLATSRWAATGEQELTAASKQAYLAYVGSVKTVDDIAARKCTPITTDGSVCTDLKVKPQVVRSADGAVSGFMYLVMQTQAVSYDPSVVVEMVGSVAGRPVRVSGAFRVYDQLYQTLGGSGVQAQPNAADWGARVQAARAAFNAGNPPADTVDAYGRIAAAVSSMRLGK